MTTKGYINRISRHTDDALAGELRTNEVVEVVISQAGPMLAYGIWASMFPLLRLFGAPHPAYLVVTNERLLLTEFGHGFPAKADAPVAPATITKQRERHIGETVPFAGSAREMTEPGGVVGNKAIRIDENTNFWPARGWAFNTVAA